MLFIISGGYSSPGGDGAVSALSWCRVGENVVMRSKFYKNIYGKVSVHEQSRIFHHKFTNTILFLHRLIINDDGYMHNIL